MLKDVFQNTDFSLLKCQLKRKKKKDSMFVKIFQVSAYEGMGKQSKLIFMTCRIFNSKTFFKFLLAKSKTS